MIEKATIEVTIIPKIGRPGVEDKAKESFLTQIISASVLASLHPRNGLHIGLQGRQNFNKHFYSHGPCFKLLRCSKTR